MSQQTRPAPTPRTSSRPAPADPPPEVLAAFREILVLAVHEGTPPGASDLDGLRSAAARAAEQGLSAGAAVDLYLCAAGEVWRETQLGDAAGVRFAAQQMLDGVRTTLPVLVEGHQSARREVIHREEIERREFIDDLLRGDADVAGLVQRAEPFGLDLTRGHQIVLAEPRDDAVLGDREEALLERTVIELFGDRDVLVTTKGGRLLALVPGPGDGRPDAGGPAQRLHERLSAVRGGKRWRWAAGRPYVGAYGIARSYEEARDAIEQAARLQPDTAVLGISDLLLLRVLSRDRVALTDLVETLLTPLRSARGGAAPLLETLQVYFETGQVATATALRLHVSVRTVTYRLTKIARLTGLDPTVPASGFGLQVAVLGARLLQWPQD